MPLVLIEYIAVGLHACDTFRAVVSTRCNAEDAPRVLIDPVELRPSSRIGFPWRNQVKSFGIDPSWMTERTNVTRQQEVEGLELSGVRLVLIEAGERLHDGWTADGDPPDRGAVFECQSRRGQPQDVAND